MDWKLDKSRPICPQLCEKLNVAIASGELKPGERLMSVREAAVMAGVNPNTVQKSFGELERLGSVYSVRGSGWFVSEDTAGAARQVGQMISLRVDGFFADMERLGVDAASAKKYVEEWKHE